MSMKCFKRLIICSVSLLIMLGVVSLSVPSPAHADFYEDYFGKDETLSNIFIIFSSDEALEEFLHDRVVHLIESHYTVYSSTVLTEIGKKLVRRIWTLESERKLPWTFKIIEMPGYNAFAVPGGAIYVTKNLYNALNEDELAFVLGHEIVHVWRMHGVRNAKSDNTFLALRSLVGKAIGDKPKIWSTLDALANVVYTTIQAGYSRMRELTCDYDGAALAFHGGYDPLGGVKALEKLREYSAGSRSCFLWCTHPDINKRIQFVRDVCEYNLNHPEERSSPKSLILDGDVLELNEEAKQYLRNLGLY